VIAVHGSKVGPTDWDEERSWCEEMVRSDGRNNSAWAWRWYLVFGREGAQGREEEIE
jgi:protein farnesyltransferase/geranylgeranyltransferase type-1 subunit alpha